MKEINKAELVEILEDYGVDVTEQGIRSADIDHFLSADLNYSDDELDPIYNIVCQEVMAQRPDLICSHNGPILKLVSGDEVVAEFEITDADFSQDGSVDLTAESVHGEAAIKIEDSGQISMEGFLERIEQAESGSQLV